MHKHGLDYNTLDGLYMAWSIDLDDQGPLSCLGGSERASPSLGDEILHCLMLINGLF